MEHWSIGIMIQNFSIPALHQERDGIVSGDRTLSVNISDFVTSLFLLLVLGVAYPSNAAESFDQFIAGAKKEGELVIVAGAETFGGRKGFAELEAAFNKKFGLKARVNFTPGPEMNAMAARAITEVKAGRTSSDFYLGSQSHFGLLHQERFWRTLTGRESFPGSLKRWRSFLTRACWSTHRLMGFSTTPICFLRKKRPRAIWT